MKNIRIIAGKEFRGYLNSPMAYIIICVFLLITGTFFSTYLKTNRLYRYHNSGLPAICRPLLLLAFAAVITMRSLAEEKKMGTWELLLTSPVRDTDVVLGKFLAGVGLMAVLCWF